MAGPDEVHPDADVNADADGYQPPSPDDREDDTADYQSERKQHPPLLGIPPCNLPGKPAHPPPLRPDHGPLTRDLRQPPPPTRRYSPPDNYSGSAARIVSRWFPIIFLRPARCRFAGNRNLDTPPPFQFPINPRSPVLSLLGEYPGREVRGVSRWSVSPNGRSLLSNGGGGGGLSHSRIRNPELRGRWSCSHAARAYCYNSRRTRPRNDRRKLVLDHDALRHDNIGDSSARSHQ